MPDRSTVPRSVPVVRLAATRELRQRLGAKSFYAFTGVLVVVIIGIGILNRLVGDDDPGAIEIGVSEPVPEDLPARLTVDAGLFDREVEIVPFADAAAARMAVEDGDVDVAIVAADGEMIFAEDVDDAAADIIQRSWSSIEIQRSLVDAGLTTEQVEQALSPTPLEMTTLDGADETSGLAILTGTLAGVLLFGSLQTFGGYVLMGVVEEKSTAVVEVLMVRARPDQMLAGKVIGIGLAALLQFAVAVAAGVVSLSISGIDVPGEIWSALPMTLVWFLGGYALYSTLFALAGSLVSRQEDAQAAAGPITTVLIGAYVLIFIFGYVPDSTASTVLSLLPPIAPLLMPMRMAAGAASVIEVVAALVLLVATTYAMWKLAGRIYEQVLLRRGSRISWREALSTLR